MRLKEKVLNELLDFCKYGYCLEEETEQRMITLRVNL